MNSYDKKVDPLKAFRHDFLPVQSVISSADLISDLIQFLKSNGAKKVVLITTTSLIKNSAEVKKIKHALDVDFGGEENVLLFSGLHSNTPREDVIHIINTLKNQDVDYIIAIGGGSIVDGAKMIRFCLENNIYDELNMKLYAKFSNGEIGKKFRPDHHSSKTIKTKIITIPTTLSGASYSVSASVTDKTSRKKEGYKSISMSPQAIFYSPALTLETPEWLWFSTAIRAMDHAVEGLCSTKTNAYLDGQFLHALRLFAQSLPETKNNFKNLSARSISQQAEWLACCGSGKVSYGASHGLGYILSEMFGVPHGFTSCVLLPAVMEWNSSVCASEQKNISESLGVPDQPAFETMKLLVQCLSLPSSLRDLGRNGIDIVIPESSLKDIAQRAFLHPVTQSNPRRIERVEDIVEILRLAW